MKRPSLIEAIPLPADRYDARFGVAAIGALAFTVLTYLSVTYYWEVRWFTGEDGVTEWWSVATFLAAAAMAALTARALVGSGYAVIGGINALLAVAFLSGALEEVSWGQRLFGWSTPGALAGINKQSETNVHNIPAVEDSIATIFLWASIVALAGAVVRAYLHRRGWVTTADFLLPRLFLAPLLLMIVVWFADAQPFLALRDRFIFNRPEVPEVVLGMCVILYTAGNLRTVRALMSHRASVRSA